jgi:uncharacterized YigZ family protein
LTEIIDKYYTIKEHFSSEIKISKSVFISNIFSVDSKEKIKENLSLIRKKINNAHHHPYAYRLGLDENNFKANDYGEPSGSSGKPILEVIDKYELTNVMLIVSRIFGGVKLGIGGLKRAYFESAESCVVKENIITKYLTEFITAEFDYKYINQFMNYLEKHNIKILENNSDEAVRLKFEMRLSFIDNIKKDLTNLTNGSLKFITY